MAFTLGFTDEIVWLGVQPHRRVIEEFQACDILIQLSVTARNSDSEGGAPTIILEAQACGIPVVSTAHADIPYVTRRNDTALLSPERDVDSLADNMGYLFENPHLWPVMGLKGRKHIAKYHDVIKEVRALENIYTNSISFNKAD